MSSIFLQIEGEEDNFKDSHPLSLISAHYYYYFTTMPYYGNETRKKYHGAAI